MLPILLPYCVIQRHLIYRFPDDDPSGLETCKGFHCF